MRVVLTAAAAGIVIGCVGTASSQTTIDGFTFDDDAFLDLVLGTVGDPSPNPAAFSVQQAITGSDTDSFVQFDPPAGGGNVSVTGSFTDNHAINLPGDDIVVFEVESEEELALTINAMTIFRTPMFTGSLSPVRSLGINAAAFDLEDFGIAPNGLVSMLTVARGMTDNPDIAVIGAVNSVPASP